MDSIFPTLLDVSNKGQILIPVGIRKALGIKPKGKVFIYAAKESKKLVMEPFFGDPIEAACGLLTDKSKSSWSKELVEERTKDLKKEEKNL